MLGVRGKNGVPVSLAIGQCDVCANSIAYDDAYIECPECQAMSTADWTRLVGKVAALEAALADTPENVEAVASLMWNRTMESALWPRWEDGLKPKLKERPLEDARAILAVLRARATQTPGSPEKED